MKSWRERTPIIFQFWVWVRFPKIGQGWGGGGGGGGGGGNVYRGGSVRRWWAARARYYYTGDTADDPPQRVYTFPDPVKSEKSVENFWAGIASQVNSSPDLPLIPGTIDSSDQISIFANRKICGIWPLMIFKALVKYLLKNAVWLLLIYVYFALPWYWDIWKDMCNLQAKPLQLEQEGM